MYLRRFRLIISQGLWRSRSDILAIYPSTSQERAIHLNARAALPLQPYVRDLYLSMFLGMRRLIDIRTGLVKLYVRADALWLHDLGG